jgi:hypothetical protein
LALFLGAFGTDSVSSCKLVVERVFRNTAITTLETENRETPTKFPIFVAHSKHNKRVSTFDSHYFIIAVGGRNTVSGVQWILGNVEMDTTVIFAPLSLIA